MVFVVFLNFVASNYIVACKDKGAKRLILIAIVSVDLALIAFFKYTYFFLENVNKTIGLLGGTELSLGFRIILPLGISFFTFQAISYVVDVYRGNQRVEKNFFLVGSYIFFFPQLIAGPILRAGDVIWQLAKRPPFDAKLLETGLRRILYGLFLKVCVADQIGQLVDRGFSTDPEVLGAFDVWALAWMFGFQIYFDFSAYSHIAIGSALLFGIRFPENFNFPYLATSPKEFWQRWHISLSSWARDYIYLPICCFNKRSVPADRRGIAEDDANLSVATRNSSLIVTFLLMGLWHGAGWTFIFWGAWQAILVLVYRGLAAVSSYFPYVRKELKIAILLPLVMLGWIPFRAPTMDHAAMMLTKIMLPVEYFPTLFGGAVSSGFSGLLNISLGPDIFLAVMLITCGFFICANWHHFQNICRKLNGHVYNILDVVFLSTVFSLTFIYLQQIDMFIYFQF